MKKKSGELKEKSPEIRIKSTCLDGLWPANYEQEKVKTRLNDGTILWGTKTKKK